MSETPWIEVDCPRCGIDYDIEPVPHVGDVVRCPCGHTYTDAELASGNVGQWVDGEYRYLPNPWRTTA